MATFQQKLSISIGSAVLFAAVNLAQTYQFTNNFFPTFDPVTGCPTANGQLIHTAVFFLLSFITMGDPRVDTGNKIKNSLYGSLIFFLLTSPAMYAFTSSIFGPSIATPQGCPTLLGVLLHTVVYCLALVAVMYLPN